MRSAVVEQIYRTAFGADYPAAADPSAFYSATTLQLVVSALQLSRGNVVADLGCGHGGPGLWAARQTGATLIGIDLSPAGIELARRQALAEGIIAAEAEVAEDMGRHYTAMARVFLADLPSLRYILVTARRPARTPG